MTFDDLLAAGGRLLLCAAAGALLSLLLPVAVGWLLLPACLLVGLELLIADWRRGGDDS